MRLSKPMKYVGYFAAMTAMIAVSDIALAEGGEGLSGVANRVTSSIQSIGQLITAAAWVAGIGFFLTGLVKFKSHRDNPTQVPLSAPIILICVGAGLVFLPSVINIAGDTAFESKQAGGASGTGFSSFDAS